MRGFRFRKSVGRPLGQAFYCRHHNRLVGDCPLTEGPCTCPVRRECQAFAGSGPSRGASGASTRAS